MVVTPSARERRGPRRLLALLAFAGAILSAARYARDASLRREAEALAPRPRSEATKGIDSKTLALEPAWDLAADDIVTEAVLGRDAAASPAFLPRASRLMRRAAASRPGWPVHWYLLALCDEPKSGERPRRVLKQTVQDAPGFEPAWKALARSEMDAWSRLSAAERSEAENSVKLAARDASFVELEFPRMVGILGADRAAALLPEDSEVLESAAASLAQTGDVRGAASLLSRADLADRREIAKEIEALERRRSLGDVEGLRRGCIACFDRHPLEGLDDPEGRRALAKLLSLWPDDRFGSWSRDRRARIVKFFLDGRQSDVPPEALRRAVGALTGVPDAVRARVEVLAGNLAEARAIARASASSASPDWRAYALELARNELGAGRIAEAARSLEDLAPGAGDTCDALLLRREIGRRLGDSAESDAAERRLAVLRDPAAEDWSSRGSLSICVDPQWSEGRYLEVVVGAGAPALLTWGWDAGRAGAVSLPPEETSVKAPLQGLSGARMLWVSFLVGGQGRTLHTLLRRAS